MQIPSTPHSGTAASLSIANRSAAGQQQAVETRSRVMPAVQQPVEVEAAVNRQNPANRPTLVDEEVRLYGPFNNNANANASAAATPEPPVAEQAPAALVVDDQAQNRQSQQQDRSGAEDDAQAAASDSDTSTGTNDSIARQAERSETAARAAADATEARTAAREADNKKDDAREARIEQVEQRQISKLASRDREVRAHEAAHASIGGQHAGSASFSMTRGPNGVSYATGGEVPIDVSAVPGDPEATIRKMQTVQRAALAPAQPSSADRAVAAQAAQVALQARADVQSAQAEQRATQVEAARQQRAESAEKRAEISDRLASIQDRFNFSDTLGDAQRSRQIAIVAQGYGPLRAGAIGTLFDERV